MGHSSPVSGTRVTYTRGEGFHRFNVVGKNIEAGGGDGGHTFLVAAKVRHQTLYQDGRVSARDTDKLAQRKHSVCKQQENS